jgi:type II secretory pathway pseudopilin PulG
MRHCTGTGRVRLTTGMTLLELMIALSLAALLLLGLIQIVSAASSATRLQRNQAQLQENARLAITLISRFAREAGFNPEPWDRSRPDLGLVDDSMDNVSVTSDRLAVRSWSDINCFDNRNPELDSHGNPAFYVRESVFDLNASRGLTWQCRYGPALTEMVTQIRRQGFIQNVDSFQVLYGEDSNQDSIVDHWVKAGHWIAPEQILGIRFGLLLASEDRVAEQTRRTFKVLDSLLEKKADGFLRRVFGFTTAIRSKTG